MFAYRYLFNELNVLHQRSMPDRTLADTGTFPDTMSMYYEASSRSVLIPTIHLLLLIRNEIKKPATKHH